MVVIVYYSDKVESYTYYTHPVQAVNSSLFINFTFSRWSNKDSNTVSHVMKSVDFIQCHVSRDGPDTMTKMSL